MFTYFKSINVVSGAESLISFLLLSIIFYLVVYFIFKYNRTKKGIVTGIIGLFLSLVITDLVWYSYYFPKGEYINYGLGGSLLVVPILPLTMIIFIVAISIYNKRTK